MSEEKKVKVTFRQNLQDGSPDNPVMYKENQTLEIPESFFNLLVKSGIKVEQANAK